jgi:hypothetical protein
MTFTDILNAYGVDPDSVIEDEQQQESADEAASEEVGTIGSPEGPPGEVPEDQFPNNPPLAGANTDNGGIFANLPGGQLAAIKEGTKMSEFPTEPVDGLGFDGKHVMLVVYANTSGKSIDISIDSTDFGASSQTLGAGAYDESKFAVEGSDAPWVRIPTGIGTPQPSDPGKSATAYDKEGNFVGNEETVTHDYELKAVNQTDDGFEVVWEQLEEVSE